MEQAREVDPGTVWDSIVESAPPLENMTASPKRSAVLPLSVTPKRIHRPTVPRTLRGIHPALRVQIRQLVRGEAPWPLFIFGSVGVGKTCSLLGLLDFSPPGGLAYEAGPDGKKIVVERASPQYFTMAALLDQLITANKGRLYQRGADGGPRRVWPEELWEDIASASLVVIDELGCRELVTPFAYDTLRRILDDREGKPLAISSNIGLDKIAELYDDRIASRLAAGTVVKLDGPDRRLSKEPMANG